MLLLCDVLSLSYCCFVATVQEIILPPRRRDVSATLNGVEFQRTEIFTFQTIWAVADINHIVYQLAGILTRLFYCY